MRSETINWFGLDSIQKILEEILECGLPLREGPLV
jgi:hypothetical protein